MRPEDDASIVFFVDRSLGGRHVVLALEAAGADVVAHDKVLSPAATDVEWLTAAGVRGWVVLTKDERILRNPIELETVKSRAVRMFTLTRQDLPGQEMAALFVRSLGGMRKRIASTAGPFVFRISRSGDFKRLF